VRVGVELGFVLFTFFAVAPSIAAAIGYAAWKGRPKSFDREMYWTVFECCVDLLTPAVFRNLVCVMASLLKLLHELAK
jgi:hypothetical protein